MNIKHQYDFIRIYLACNQSPSEFSNKLVIPFDGYSRLRWFRCIEVTTMSQGNAVRFKRIKDNTPLRLAEDIPFSPPNDDTERSDEC